MMATMRVRPIERWPREQTPAGERKPSPFLKPNVRRTDGSWTGRREVPHSQTLRDLDTELAALGVDEVVVQIAVRERDLRVDGTLRADARPSFPGVIVTVTPPGMGVVTFACDRFEQWQTNLRAIVLGMEALRKVERYGIAESNEQYAGYRALGSGTPMTGPGAESAPLTVQEAGRIVVGWVSGAHDLETNARTAIEDADYRRFAHRQAVKALHPDRGGDPEAFRRLEAAMSALNENDHA